MAAGILPGRRGLPASAALAETRYQVYVGSRELSRLGCERRGAAVDFIVEHEIMLEVARWIVANLPFDRLYFYGDELPVRVSFGPEQTRRVVRMVVGRAGRLVPRVVLPGSFLAEP